MFYFMLIHDDNSVIHSNDIGLFFDTPESTILGMIDYCKNNHIDMAKIAFSIHPKQ